MSTFDAEPMVQGLAPGKDPVFSNRRISLMPSDVTNRRQSMAPAQGTGQQRPSIVGLLASKRFAKWLSKRFISMRTGSIMSSRLSEAVIINREPTYRMEPLEKFEEAKVREIIKECTDCRLMDYKYNAKQSALMCKVLSEEIKEKVKYLNYDRYKIVVMAYIGERKDQCVRVTSRCVWDQNFDNYASYTYKNDNVFCSVTVYGVYNE